MSTQPQLTTKGDRIVGTPKPELAAILPDGHRTAVFAVTLPNDEIRTKQSRVRLYSHVIALRTETDQWLIGQWCQSYRAAMNGRSAAMTLSLGFDLSRPVEATVIETTVKETF